MEYRVRFLENEFFWGGAVANGLDMPISAESEYERDYTDGGRNQLMPLFLSSKGRYIWSEDPFKVWVENKELCFEGTGFELYDKGTCLKDAYLAAMEKHFPFTETRKNGKKMPDVFSKPRSITHGWSFRIILRRRVYWNMHMPLSIMALNRAC